MVYWFWLFQLTYWFYFLTTNNNIKKNVRYSYHCFFLSRSSCCFVSNHLYSSENSVDFFHQCFCRSIVINVILYMFFTWKNYRGHRFYKVVCSLHSNQFDFDCWKIFVEKPQIMPPQKTTVGIELHYPYPSFQPTLPCCKLPLEKSEYIAD